MEDIAGMTKEKKGEGGRMVWWRKQEDIEGEGRGRGRGRRREGGRKEEEGESTEEVDICHRTLDHFEFQWLVAVFMEQ